MKKNNNKKYLVLGSSLFVLVLFLAILSFTNASASSPYLPSDNPLGEDVHNIYLLDLSDNLLTDDSGYLNMITYVNENGEFSANVFMDTFGIRGANLTERMEAVEAIDTKVAEINRANNSTIKVNVMMALNVFEDDSRVNTFAPISDEITQQIEDQVDDIITRFINAENESIYSNINLVGFYWAPENVNIASSTFAMIEHFNDYVHGKGYKTLWTPTVTSYDRLHDGLRQISIDDLNYACSMYGNDLNSDACDSESTYSVVDGVRVYKDELYVYGYEYGFDFVSLQSGYEFSGDGTAWNKYRSGSENEEVDRLGFTDQQALKMHAGVVISMDPDNSSNGSYYGYKGCSWYKDMLSYGMTKEWNRSINVYSFNTEFDTNYLGQNGIARAYYDAAYKYVTGTITDEDIITVSCERDYYSTYANVAKGKSYTSSAVKYTAAPDDDNVYGYYKIDGNQDEVYVIDNERYCKNGTFIVDSLGNKTNKWKNYLLCDDGVKLTDGEFGKSSYSKYDEWVGFYNSTDNKPYTIVVDLAEDMESLSYFGIELNGHAGGGLKVFPRDVSGSAKVYVSSNGEQYAYVGTLNFMEDRNIFEAAYYDLKLDELVAGRYVKFAIDLNSSSGMVYVSEVIVGRTSSISFSKNKSIVNVGIGDPAITYTDSVDIILDNASMNDLDITIDTEDDITFELDENTLNIKSMGVGTANIKVRDTRYGNEAILNVQALGRFKIDFDANGGVNSGATSIYAAYNYDKFYANKTDINYIDNLVPVPNKDGYEFLGWYSSKSGGIKIFNSSGELVSNVEDYVADDKWIMTDDVKLYAHYKSITQRYKVEFNSNGGKLIGSNILYVEHGGTALFENTTDDTEVKAPTSTRTNYTFLGWYSSNGDKVLNSYGDIVSGNLVGYISSGSWDIDSNITLYAQYMENSTSSYTVSYNCVSNGGYFDGPYDIFSKKYSEGSKVDLSYLCLIEGEYNFIGWNTDKNAKVALDSYSMTNKNVTLYGIFSEILPEDGRVSFKDVPDFSVNSGINMLYNVVPGYNFTSLLENVTLSRESDSLTVIDTSDVPLTEGMKLRTGYKLRVEFSTNVVEYKISVKGDVLGTGELSVDGAKMIVRHIINKDVISGKEYLLAADYNNDGEIKMNDVVRMMRELKGSSD